MIKNKKYITILLLYLNLFLIGNSYGFSSRDILDKGKTTDNNSYFNSITKKIVGKEGEVSGIEQNITLDSLDGGDLNFNDVGGGNNINPLIKGNNTSTGTGNTIIIGGNSLSELEINSLKAQFLLKLKNKNQEEENFSIVDKNYSDFLDFLYKNTTNDNFNDFLNDVLKQLDKLKNDVYRIRESLYNIGEMSNDDLEKNKINEKLKFLDQLTYNIIPTYQLGIDGIINSNSSFEGFLGKYAYSRGLNAYYSKILSVLNNPFSVGIKSVQELVGNYIKLDEKANKNLSSKNYGSNGNKQINLSKSKNNKQAKNIKKSVGGSKKNQEIKNGIIDINIGDTPPPTGGSSGSTNPPSGLSDNEIIQKIKDSCYKLALRINPSFYEKNGFIDAYLQEIITSNITPTAVSEYKKNGKVLSSMCKKEINRCYGEYTKYKGFSVYHGGTLNVQNGTCRKKFKKSFALDIIETNFDLTWQRGKLIEER